MIIYGAIELFSGVAQIPGDNVAHFAHLGGLFTGLLIILFGDVAIVVVSENEIHKMHRKAQSKRS